MKFTFKSVSVTGQYRSFYPTTHDIKLKKITVGSIDGDKPFSIRLKVIKDDINENDNPSCVWKWIRLTKESETLKEAKQWLVDNTDIIINTYNLYIDTR